MTGFLSSLPQWLLCSLGCLLLTGSGNFVLRLAGTQGLSSLAIGFIVFAVHIVLTGLMLWLFPKVIPEISAHLDKPAGWQSIGYSCLGALLFASSFIVLVTGLNSPGAKAGLVIGVLNTNFVLVSLLAWMILGEALNWKQIAGVVLMIFGIVCFI